MYFFILAAGAFLAGIIINGILRSCVNELAREAEEIDHTSFTFFRQMKLKYENYLKMGHEINNTEAFAGKYLDKYRRHGIRLQSFEKASACAAGLCVIFGACGALLDKSHALEYLLAGFLAMYVVAGSRQLIDIPAKKKRITINLVDYFENRFSAATMETCKPERTNRERARGRDADYERDAEALRSRTERKSDGGGEKEPLGKFNENVKISFSEEEKKLIDEILKEYLG